MIVVHKNFNTKIPAPYVVNYKEHTFYISLLPKEARPEDFKDTDSFNIIMDFRWIITETRGGIVVFQTDISANEYFLEDAIKYAWTYSHYKQNSCC